MGLTNWFRRRPSDDELREELEAHLAMRAEHDGVDEVAAHRRMGNMLRTREEMRRVWIADWWDALRQDAWFTWRSWWRQPGFALGAILVLALGLGASTALFAALDRVLFRPLPYGDPDRLVSVGLVTARQGESLSSQTETMSDRAYVQQWSTPPAPFVSVTAMVTRPCDIGERQPERVSCALVGHNFLRVLSVRPALGRDFTPEEDLRGTPLVALISHGLWVRRYGADPGVVGRSVTLETLGAPRLQVPIVGVLPAAFEMPVDAGDVLLPLQLRPLDPAQTFNLHIMTLARLKPEVTVASARLMLGNPLPAMAEFIPRSSHAEWRVRPLRDRRVGNAAAVAWLLVGAVAIFMMIACVNVANLMFARMAERRREFAVRAAIGADRLRVARLVLVESLVLALAAGSAGLLLASGLIGAFVAMAPAGVPGIAEASIDGRVFAAALLLVVVSGTAIGLWPAISVFRAGGMQGLRSTRSSHGARPHVRFALVTMQIALTLALLAGAALLLHSLRNVLNVPLGFDGERVVTADLSLSQDRYPTAQSRSAFFDELVARARMTPGAISVAMSGSPAPRGRSMSVASIEVEGRPVDPTARHRPVRVRQVTPQYFETFRMPAIRGRTGAAVDRSASTVVLSQLAERVLFAGEPSLGRRIQTLDNGPWYTVIGVVADVRNGQGITDEPEPEIYVSASAASWSGVGYLAVRTTADSTDAAAYLHQVVVDLDPTLSIAIETVDQQVARLTAGPRFIAGLLTAFAVMALVLAAAGLYSVVAYLVAQRRRDIGVRLALGAAPGDVARQVIGEAGRWLVAGALLGSAFGWLSTRALRVQLYEVQALDPWSWTGALATLAVVLAIAVLRPAYRAAHVDPVVALRAD